MSKKGDTLAVPSSQVIMKASNSAIPQRREIERVKERERERERGRRERELRKGHALPSQEGRPMHALTQAETTDSVVCPFTHSFTDPTT